MEKGFLYLNKEGFEETKEIANKQAKKMDDKAEDWEWEETDLKVYDFCVENGVLRIGAEMEFDGKHIANTGINIKVTPEIAEDIIEHYRKKLAKMKTILEAMR
ncbi:MAG: hypothetical protein ACOCTT_04095 [archaeon]